MLLGPASRAFFCRASACLTSGRRKIWTKKDRKGVWNIPTNEGFIICRKSFSRNIIIRMTKRRKVRWVGM